MEMNRKLIQLSPSTAVVSLPSPWIKRNKLKKGAELTLEENENRIIISTDSKKNDREITLDVSKLNSGLMWLTIDAAYAAGYDLIHIITADAKQSAYMTTVVRYFPGMIIEEERKNRVLFKDMGTEIAFDKILSRIYNLTIALLEDAIDACKSGDKQTLLNIKHRDYTINSYISLCLRHLNKHGFTQFSKTGEMHSYIRALEVIADRICELAKEKKLSQLQQILTLYRKVPELHFSFTQQKLIEFEKQVSDVFRDLLERELALHIEGSI